MTDVTSVQLATDVAERKRDAAGRELVLAQRAHRFAQDQLDQLETYAIETIARWTAVAQVSATPVLMRHHYQFMERLNQAIQMQKQILVEQNHWVEVARKGAGIASRAAAMGVSSVTSLSFMSITVRPFSSYLRDVAMLVVPTVCQSASTRSQVTSPQILS